MGVCLGRQGIDGDILGPNASLLAPAAVAPAVWRSLAWTHALALPPAHGLQQPDACAFASTPVRLSVQNIMPVQSVPGLNVSCQPAGT